MNLIDLKITLYYFGETVFYLSRKVAAPSLYITRHFIGYITSKLQSICMSLSLNKPITLQENSFLSTRKLDAHSLYITIE